ncbi:MAG: PUR family DNA/RNA-binding protein [Bacteroidia bacterium]|nr:DUF3276 family protein [Bacteroidia bacterium]MCZ2278136.1 PUR family DNA/RNA-binding protein [Bacteroidia bacterium]
MNEHEHHDQSESFSKAVRAGKRTYFFDVKSTRSNDFYLTITESKRMMTNEGEKPVFRKHKIFLYREDFQKFIDGLSEAIDYINQHPKPENQGDQGKPLDSRFSDIDYDDLAEPGAEGNDPQH